MRRPPFLLLARSGAGSLLQCLNRMRSTRSDAGRIWLGLMLGIGFIVAGPGDLARAESKIRLSLPAVLENVTATTFDESGKAVGSSSFEIVSEATGIQRMKIEMGIDGGGINRSEATLTPIPTQALGSAVGTGAVTGQAEPVLWRIIEERSQATRADGVSLDLLVIDHIAGRASCYPANGDLTKGKHVELPEDDRVLNVPMQLLFKPLAMGEVDDVHFEIVLCRNGPVLHKMIAVRRKRSRQEGREVIEVSYGPDLGSAVAWLASRLLPRFSTLR